MSGVASRRRGRARELQWRDKLRADGWWAERIDGAADVVAMKHGEKPCLWQIKSTLTPYAHFGREDRLRLRDQAAQAGATCALLWWPKGKGIERAEEFDESVWPG